MKTHHKKCKSKRQKLHTKYNIKKKIREHRRRLKKEAKRLGLSKRVRKDPGIPNTWPFKAELLASLEAQKAKKDAEQSEKHRKAKVKTQEELKQKEIDRREVQQLREAARRERRAQEAKKWHLDAFRKTLPQADVLLCVLDSRDPQAFRCKELETWALENKKRLVFVLAKADLITPEAAAKWLLIFGKIAPTVVVQAEAGREGIQELIALLGHAPTKAASMKIAPAKAVGVLGYAGTGKRQVCKAIRQELKTTVPWLLDACRLEPKATPVPTASLALHATICANVPRGAASATSAAATVASGSNVGATDGVDPMDVIKEFLARASKQAVCRHFRLPTFENGEDFVKTFGKDRKVKTKKGKVPPLDFIAQRILAELPALPGCFTAPPAEGIQESSNFWSTHGDAKQSIELVMQQQVTTLTARGVSGPAATALTITYAAGIGPSVDIAGTLEEGEEPHIDGEDDVSEDGSEMSDDDMDYESGEEEYFEGEESDDGMSDGEL